MQSLFMITVMFTIPFIDRIQTPGAILRYSAKVIYKISLIHGAGLEYHGVEKMNLNSEHNDPSIVRARLYWIFRLVLMYGRSEDQSCPRVFIGRELL
ncbi:MAG: hypothetical protein IPF68_19670 [Bacteroidales bacterium]|nr:hypothetical protein [Bacteroidales bacterium]